MELHGDRSVIEASARESELSSRLANLRRQRSGITQSILTIAREYGTDDLGSIQNDTLAQIAALDNQATELRAQIHNLESQAVPTSGDSPVAHMDSRQLAERDPKLAGLFADLDRTERLLDIKQPALGPEHREIRRLMQQRDSYLALIESRVNELQGALLGLSPTGAPITLENRLDQLRTLLDESIAEREKIRARARDVGNKRLEIESLRRDENELSQRIDETARELDKVRTEKPNLERGRIHVVQRGELPSTPSTDRRLALAMAGGGFGFAVGAGCIGLLVSSGVDFDISMNSENSGGTSRSLAHSPI